MAELALKLIETEEVESKALSIVEQANMVKVTDAESYRVAGFLWKTIGEVMKEVSETFDPIISATHKAHTQACDQKKKYYVPLEKAYKEVKRLMGVFESEQERIRQEEQRRLEEEARISAEEHLLKDAIYAEEEALQNGASPEEAAQEAEAVISQPVRVAPVVLPKATPKVQGVVFRTIWKFRIKDANAIPRQYLIPDEKAIGAVVRSSQGRIRIAGIEPYEERV